MGIYSKKACEYFKDGYNCAQSVLLAFSDIIGFDKETSLKLSSSFGGGMGRLREVCGAVSSMFMVAGLLKGYTTPSKRTEQYYNERPCENCIKTAAEIIERRLLN